MPPDSSSFTPLNIPNDAVPEWMGSFTLAAPPNTDLWRKPPSRDTSTAPILFTALRNPFIAAEVTVSADWELEWDQGGLVIFAGAPPGRVATATPQPASSTPSTTTTTTTTASTTTTTSSPNSSTTGPQSASAGAPRPSTTTPSSTTTTPSAPSTPNSSTLDNPTPPSNPTSTSTTPQNAGQPTPSAIDTDTLIQALPPPRSLPPPAYVPPAPASKWVKVGLEFCNNACHATSVCATSDGADWALTALPPHHARRTDLRIKMERIGYALWVWYEDEVSGWKKLREVTWFFWGVEDKAVRVGVYASRPANFGVSVWERRNGVGGSGGGGGQRNLCVDFEGLEIY